MSKQKEVKAQFEAQLRLRFDGAMLFMDTFPNIFALFSVSGGEGNALSIKYREEDILLVARSRDGDRPVVLFASHDNFVDALFAMDAQIGAGAWREDKWAQKENGKSK